MCSEVSGCRLTENIRERSNDTHVFQHQNVFANGLLTYTFDEDSARPEVTNTQMNEMNFWQILDYFPVDSQIFSVKLI